jgi:hypothetical protein
VPAKTWTEMKVGRWVDRGDCWAFEFSPPLNLPAQTAMTCNFPAPPDFGGCTEALIECTFRRFTWREKIFGYRP